MRFVFHSCFFSDDRCLRLLPFNRQDLPLRRRNRWLPAFCLMAVVFSLAGPAWAASAAEATHESPCPQFELSDSRPLCGAVNQTLRPEGFGSAGFLGVEQMGDLPWVYSWGFHRASSYDNERFLPMIWGGPPNLDIEGWQAGEYGVFWDKGCANQGGTGCTPAQRQCFAKMIVHQMVEELGPNACGRTWLVFNEPDLTPPYPVRDSAGLDAAEAALLYDEIVRAVRAQDPSAEFYCCGTWDNREDVFLKKPNYQHDWLDTFLQTVTEPIHGFHVHNYGSPEPVDAAVAFDEMVNIMTWFSNYFENVETSNGQNPALGELPIVITESGGIGWPNDALEEQKTLMQSMAQWLNGAGREQHRYGGAAWFVSRRATTAPCQYVEGDPWACRFSSRTVFRIGEGEDTQLLDSITAYDRSFTFDATDTSHITAWKDNGRELRSTAFYADPEGPCGDDSACNFATRTVYDDQQGQMMERITRDGRFYEYEWTQFPPTLLHAGVDLTTGSLHYDDANGPCEGQSTGNCHFDTQTVFMDVGGQLVESVTVGKWAFNHYQPLAGPSFWSQPIDLTTVWPYSALCKSSTLLEECAFDTRTIFWDDQGDLVDSITTPWGAYYNLKLVGGQLPFVIVDFQKAVKEVDLYNKPPTFTALYYPGRNNDTILVDETWRFPRKTELGEEWLEYVWGVVP